MRHNFWKRMAVVVLVFCSLTVSTAYASTTQDSIDDAKEQIDDLQEQKEEAENQVNDISNQKEGVFTQMTKLFITLMVIID